MAEERSQREWARSAEELAAAPLAELVASGPVALGTVPRLCYLAAAQSASGRLVVDEDDARRYELWFKRGVPELARANLPELQLLAWLRKGGRLAATAVAQAEEALPRCGGDPVAALLALGLLPHAEAFATLGAHGRAVFERALLVEHGRFAWDAAAAPPPGTFPLGDKWGLLTAAGRALDLRTVARRLGERIDCPVMRAGDGLVALEVLGLNAHEMRAVASFDGTRSLAMLAAASPGEAETIYRTGLFLAELGLASFARARLQRPAAAPVPGREAQRETARTPGPARPAHGHAATPGPARAHAQRQAADPRFPSDAAGLRTFLADLEGKNHFEVLGLPRSATANLIKQAFFQRARAFHPDLTAGPDPDTRKLREVITARLNEAWSCLSDDKRRAAYLAELDAGDAGRKIDVANVLVAEQLFSQATVLVKARRFADALAELDRAIALHPDEGEYYAWRGFARFSAALDKRVARDEAMAEIEHALALNERCAPAFLFSARIATVLGDAEGAMKYYRRCLAVDGANLEAQRELRLLESRKSK